MSLYEESLRKSLIGKTVRFCISKYHRGFISEFSTFPFEIIVIRNTGYDISFGSPMDFNELYEYFDGNKWTQF